MLPDFPRAKTRARAAFIIAVKHRIPQVEPILSGIAHRFVHEGRTAKLTRADDSVDDIEFQKAQAEVLVPKEQMRRITVEQISEHINAMAQQLAGHQVRLMFSRLNEAVERVGNSVSASEIGSRAAYLEVQRRIEVDFDPDTLEPGDLTIVVSPDRAEAFMEQIRVWNEDPEFVAEMNRIRAQQLEDWRARENCRRLVD